jgi:small subunit ribosomal protein S4e
MHQTRKESSIRLPIKRKGTKYLVRPKTHVKNSVPVAIAVREMLGLAQTSKEVKKMIHEKMIKINGKLVEDLHESIKLFNVLEAGKEYRLSILPTGKFVLEPYSLKEGRLCKVTGRSLVSGKKIQIHLHDGTNVIGKESINVNDSVYLDADTKVKKHVALEKGSEVFIIKGRHEGHKGKVNGIEGKFVEVHGKGGIYKLEKSNVIAI